MSRDRHCQSYLLHLFHFNADFIANEKVYQVNDMQLWFSLAMFNKVANIQQEIQNNYAHFIR